MISVSFGACRISGLFLRIYSLFSGIQISPEQAGSVMFNMPFSGVTVLPDSAPV